MKATTIFLGLASAAIASANIIFKHVPLNCNKTDNSRMFHGCLVGQECSNDGQCLPQNQVFGRRDPVYLVDRQAAYSMDGTCGPANGNTICNPSSTVYTGSCCSQYGWCGNDAAHCDAGCLSGACTGSAGSTTPRSDGRCGSGFDGATCDAAGPFGGCCSQYGYCGSTTDHCLVSNGCQNGCSAATGTSPAATSTTGEPVISAVTSTAAPASTATALVTKDGTCGTSNNNEICGNWANGNCCSMYGFCGNTTAHCGAGCQSGDCVSAPAVSAPSASAAPAAPNGGSFQIIGQSGVPAMHAALMPNGRVFFLDKVENYTQLTLPDGEYAYSSEYDPADNTVAPLGYKTNAFCSGGTFLADGRVISVGGNAPLTWLDPTVGDGFDAIRYLDRSPTDASLNGQDWSEPGNKLNSDRWYATAQTMPDGTVFVASGSLNGLDPTVLANNNPTYEILSKTAVTQGESIPMDILANNVPYYMYPFVNLLADGSLFVFVSKSSEIFDVATNTTVKSLPELPGEYRTYPNTGGSVMLPLTSANGYAADIIICGGGAYQDITSPCEASCGRIQPMSANAAWEMEAMPQGRGMVEGTLLPDGTIIWMNGVNKGSQGYELGADATLGALLYTPTAPVNERFQTLASSTIPRVYHSVSVLLLDGTILVAGSGPYAMPVLELSPWNQYPYLTEFRVEIYTPPYLQGDNANKRPTDVVISTATIAPNGSKFTVNFTAPAGSTTCNVVLYHGGFVTHSIKMGHRMINLDSTGYVAGATGQSFTVTAPPNNNVTPPGPYVVYVLCDGVPAIGQFVMVS